MCALKFHTIILKDKQKLELRFVFKNLYHM